MEQGRQYYITDLETGTLIPVSKEVHEAYKKSFDYWRSIIEPKLPLVIGKPILYGTGGDMEEGGNGFKELFFNSTK